MKYKINILIGLLLLSVYVGYGQARDFESVSVDSIVQRYKFEVTYNEISGDILLADKRNIIKLIPGSKYIEYNKRVYELPTVVRMINGQIILNRKLIDILERSQIEDSTKGSVVARVFPPDYTIVIDAGHGGKDPGTSGISSLEKNVTLQIATLLREKLTQMGANVLMTRTKDVFIPLPERPLVASLSAADIFISLHMNASKDTTAEGVEVFVYRYQDERFENNRVNAMNQNIPFKKSLLSDDCYISMGIESDIMKIQLFNNVDRSYKLANSILKGILNMGNTVNRGIKEANFVVLRNSTCPAVLVEMGFLSHSATENKFLNSLYCTTMADHIAEGIKRFWSAK